MIRQAARTFIAVFLLLAVMNLLLGCRKHGGTSIQSVQDAAKARIGVMTGSTGEAVAKARFPQANVQTFDDIMNAVAALEAGQLDAVLTAFPTAQQVAKKNSNLYVLPEPLDQEDTAVAIRKGDGALLNDVNRIISELQADGTLASMRKRWLKSDLSPYEVPTIELPRRGKAIKIGVSATREPLTFVDANGNITGHDGELARRIAAKLHRPVEFQDMKFLALIPALKSGKVDLVITGMTATEERRKSVDFSMPYFINSQVLLVIKPASTAGSPQRIEQGGGADADRPATRLSDLAAGKIAVLTGSAGDMAARKHFPHADFQQMTAAADAALAVKTRKADAFVYDKSVLLNLAEKDPSLVILDEPVDKLSVAAAIKKDNTALLRQIDHELTTLKDDGTLKMLRAKWVDSKYKVVPPMTVLKPGLGGGALKMGTCATIEPFSFLSNGGFAGLDIELGQLLAQRLGKRLEILDMNFEALIPALQSGKIDFALSNFNVTDERKKLVLFSMPYIENDISALVRRPPLARQEPQVGAAGNSQAVQDQGKLTSPADLKNKKIGVLMGSAHSTYANQHYPNATILEYKSAADVVLAVKTKKVDAALYDAEPLRIVLREEPSLASMSVNLFSFDVGAGFGKENTSLRDQFNRFLAEIRKNGVYADMVKRWMEQGDTRMPQIESPKSGSVLRVAVSDIGLPFVAVEDNRLVGFDVEMATRFASSLGKRVQFSDMDFGSLIASVASGKDDLLISSVYITDERKKQIAFSDPYFVMGTQIFALKQNIALPHAGTQQNPSAAVDTRTQASSTRVSSLADLKDKRIGVLLGSVHDTYAMQHFPQATVLQYKSPSDLVLAVRSGKVDAAIYTRETLQEILQDDPELGLLGDNLQSYPIATGFKKGNNQLREQFNAFLAEIRKNGVYDGMVQRWLKSHDTSMPKIDNAGAKGKVIIGFVSDKGLPFTIVRNNQLIGFDIELAERFGSYLGKTIEFSDMDFGSLIAAVASGKVDMIVSTLMITEERKTKIDFSDAYYELGSNAFALKSNIAAYERLDQAPVKPSFFRSIVSSFNSNIILERRYLLIWDGLKTTVFISILATIFGTLLGSLVCFMRMSKHVLLQMPARAFISVLRGTPVLVLLMVIFYVVFASVSISPVLVAVIAFGMNFAAYASEIFRTGIQSIDRGQTEAGIAMGFTPFQTFLHIILPQTVQRILPVYKGEFISLVKMTSIVGYIAVQDLTKASDIIRSRTFDAFFPLVIVALLYFLIAGILTQGLEYLESMSNSRNRKHKEVQG
jgi:polar amino acid transport system substrate-binding protein